MQHVDFCVVLAIISVINGNIIHTLFYLFWGFFFFFFCEVTTCRRFLAHVQISHMLYLINLTESSYQWAVLLIIH